MRTHSLDQCQAVTAQRNEAERKAIGNISSCYTDDDHGSCLYPSQRGTLPLVLH